MPLTFLINAFAPRSAVLKKFNGNKLEGWIFEPKSDVIAVNTFCKSTTLTSFPEETDIQVLLDLGGALSVKTEDPGLAMNHSKTQQR